MSLGTGAFAEKNYEDEEIVSYNYGVYNLNEPELRNSAYIADGTTAGYFCGHAKNACLISCREDDAYSKSFS